MIFLVVDGGHRPQNNAAGIGMALVESAGGPSDLMVAEGTALACRAVAMTATTSRVAETEAILRGGAWARGQLGASVGGLLIFSDCADAINLARNRPAQWDVRWIACYLPSAYRRSAPNNPHSLTHWLATAAMSYSDGWSIDYDGFPPDGAVMRLIDDGPRAPRRNAMRKQAGQRAGAVDLSAPYRPSATIVPRGAVRQDLPPPPIMPLRDQPLPGPRGGTWLRSIPEAAPCARGDDWTFAGAICNRLRAA